LGIFGVELFIKGDQVYFSEVSPRPHDTGLVTLISQTLSEFALHARAILGLPIPTIEQRGASASSVLLIQGQSEAMRYHGLNTALANADTEVRLFGKPDINGSRRLGVALAKADTIDAARDKANTAIAAFKVDL
jgi:phosphoribosylglycinamide formyltransferase 2